MFAAAAMALIALGIMIGVAHFPYIMQQVTLCCQDKLCFSHSACLVALRSRPILKACVSCLHEAVTVASKLGNVNRVKAHAFIHLALVIEALQG